MISYFIDGFFALCLLATGGLVFKVFRELRALRDSHRQNHQMFTQIRDGYRDHYQVLTQTGQAVSTIDMTVRDINAHGSRILLALGDRIDDANKIIAEIDERMDAVAQHFEMQRQAEENNVVQFASRNARYPEEQYEYVDSYEDELVAEPELPQHRPLRSQETRPANRPVQWPSLEDRFSAWRQSEGMPRQQAASGRRG
jgi:hypothetical protein